MGEWYKDPKVTATRLDRMRKVADYWNRFGMGVRETARQLGVNASTVSRDRKKLVEMWAETVTADIGEVAGRELAKLDKQESELWMAWEKSKQEHVRTTNQEKRSGKRVKKSVAAVTERTTTTMTEDRLPEARYMDLIIEVGKRRERLLGLDKGIKVDLGFDFRDLVAAAADAEDAVAEAAEAAIERDRS